MSRRSERIGEQIRAEVARILREDVRDPRIGLVTLTRVDVTPDLGSACLWWSTLEREGGPSPGEIERGLASAAPFVRRSLAAALPLRRAPEIRFRRDPGLELGDRTLDVLRQLRAAAAEDDDGEV